jgi:hypothetical protein
MERITEVMASLLRYTILQEVQEEDFGGLVNWGRPATIL